MGRLGRFIEDLQIIDKGGQSHRLGEVISWPQRDIQGQVEDDVRDGLPVRYVVLKARQIGMSTWIEGLQFALAMAQQNFRGLVIAHETDSSQHLLRMSRYYYDSFWGKEAFPTKHAAANQLAWHHVNSHIKIATANNMRAGRSQTLQFLHASEVAFWDQPELLMTGLQQSVGRRPNTFIFLESTANGVGGYFYDTWEAACRGDVQYKPVFYPYWQHPDYTADNIGMGHLVRGVLVPADDEERHLIRYLGKSRSLLGRPFPPMDPAEIAQRIMWRREILGTECRGDLNTLHQEYPAEPEEAFVATGANVFDLPRLKKVYEPINGHRGRLLREGDKVRFIPDETGPLEIYRKPSENREFGWYLIGGDGKKATQSVAGREGDYCCAQVINRRSWEQVARWRGRLDQNSFGEEMIKLGQYYNEAMLAPETGIGGPGVAAHIIARGYPNLWQHRKGTKMPGQVDNTWGWISNLQTKQEAIGNVQSALFDATEPRAYQRGIGIRIHDPITYAEMKNYVVLPDGAYGNANGIKEHDDTVMALAIALTCTRYEQSMMTDDPKYAAPRYHTPHYQSELTSNEAVKFEGILGDLGVPEGDVTTDGGLDQGAGEDVPWMEAEVDYYGEGAGEGEGEGGYGDDGGY